jgi:hypothetical protein
MVENMGGPLKYILREADSTLRIQFVSTARNVVLATVSVKGITSVSIHYEDEYDPRVVQLEFEHTYRSIAPELYCRISSGWGTNSVGMFRLTATLDGVYVMDLIETVEGYSFTVHETTV